MSHTEPSHTTWVPDAAAIESANASVLMKRLGIADYERFLEFSTRKPQAYWETVLDYLGFVWKAPPGALLDDSAGAPFPRWFPGGRLNWVDTVFRWADTPGGADRPAIVSEREDGHVDRVSYGQLPGRVRDLAAGLASAGIRRGDRVAMLMENGLEATLGFLALSHLGAIVVPLFSGFGADAIVSRLESCGARAMLASTGYRRRGAWVDMARVVKQARADLPTLEFVIWKDSGEGFQRPEGDLAWADLAAADGHGRESAAMDPNDPFMVIYTSGTTGRPKGCVHVHGSFPVKVAHDSALHLEVNPGDVFSWPADMGWIAGSLVLGIALLRGATLVCYNGAPDFPDWSRMSRLIERHRVTHYGSAPTLIRGLASHPEQATEGDLSSVRLLATGGEVIAPEHATWFHRHMGQGRAPVINFTGGTEASGALLSSVTRRPIAAGAFNTISPGVHLDVVDSEGRSLTDQVGELALRAPFIGMTQSFWEDDERYLDTYWRTQPGLWIHGDLALRRSDGSFFILGRSDDTLKLAGKRVGPAEIEEVVIEWPGVVEAAAIGVEDAAKGQRLVVFIVPAPGYQGSTDRLETEVQRYVGDKLGRPFQPSVMHTVRQLPKTRSSKIMRRVIRSAYCGQPLGDLSALDNPAALDEIIALTGRPAH